MIVNTLIYQYIQTKNRSMLFLIVMNDFLGSVKWDAVIGDVNLEEA